jgi:phosphatidylethanolamine/phosphatidyl-N-methylethanolamine N-methyltransferase
MNQDRFKDPIMEYYKNSYTEIYGKGSLGKIWHYIHRSMEKPFDRLKAEVILEVGAGKGEHLNYVKAGFQEYFLTDLIIEPLKEINSPTMAKITKVQANATALPFQDNFFDRVIVTCLLNHLAAPEDCLLELRRVCKPGGQIVVYLPCEPGLLFRFVRKFTAEKKHQRKSSLDPKLIHFLEHRTSHESIAFFITKLFGKKYIIKKYFPINIPSWNLNLFAIYFIKINQQNKEFKLY